jgi:O-antigen/teichoic acid export membrane protein
VAYFYRRSPGALRELLSTIRLNFIWCIIASVALALLSLRLPVSFAYDLSTSTSFFVSLVAYTALATPASILPLLVTASGDFAAYVKLTNGSAILQTGLILVACLTFGSQYEHVVAALALGQLLLIAGVLVHLRRQLARHQSTLLGLRTVYTYGLRSQWGALMKLLSHRLDILIVSSLVTAADVGRYSLAVSLRDIGLLPQSVYAAPLQNAVIDREKNPAVSDKTLVLGSLILQVGLSVLLAVIAVVSLPYLIATIYGPSFARAGKPAVVLFTSIVFLGPAAVCWVTFNSKGRPELNSMVMTAAALIGAVSTYLLTSSHGLYGAAGAVVLTSAVTLLLSLVLLIRIQKYQASDLPVAWRRAGATARGLLRSFYRSAGTSAARDAK